jgi:uncharacterized protein YoaH (UPF0181 family)
MMYKVSSLVGTAGDAVMDAAVAAVFGKLCSSCEEVALAVRSAYDDGLCGQCRDENDAFILAHAEEANRLFVRVEALFPAMSAGQTIAFVANLLRQAVSV